MNFAQLCEQRYSVRKYDSKPIEPEKLEMILNAGRLAPTAKNFQPQRILVLKSAGILMEGTPGEVFARGDELLAAGLEVPQITRVAMELRRRSVDVGGGVYTVEELHSRLLALRKGGGVC